MDWPPPELVGLFKTKYDFYLGGSRRMAKKFYEEVHVNSATDYDLYATSSQDAEDILAMAGFTRSLIDDLYLDDQAVSIWKKGDVQVVLRKNAEFYEKVFESISAEYYVNHLWKSSQVFESHPERRALIGEHFNQMFRSAA
jgi:hypothetical protein